MATSAAPVYSSLLYTFAIDLKAIEDGLPLNRLVDFAEASGLPLKEVQDVVLPARTLKHRKAREEALSLDESDKFARAVGVFDLAMRVWKDKKRTREWLLTPKRRFDGKTPMQMMRTSFGTNMVQEMLIQIDEGMFA